MPSRPRLVPVAALLLSSLVAVSSAVAETVPFSSDRWEIKGRESRIEQHLGRESLYFKGGIAWLRDVDFLDGIVEFDLAVTGERGFMGGIWRLVDEENYEEFYIRPHMSGNPDANQYTPIFHGRSGWQLYHGDGYGAPVEYRNNAWMHIRIVVSGGQGEVYVDSEEPVLFIREMKRRVRAGKIGIVTADFAHAHFSNFSYTLKEKPVLKGRPAEAAPPLPGLIRRWSVSSPFEARLLDGKPFLTDHDTRGLTWTLVDSEPSGIVNLAAVQPAGDDLNTVFAKVSIRSDRVQVKKVLFGYSDVVKAYFNGRLIYGGTNLYRSRDYRYLGTIGFFDALYLPLREGDNELWFAVSESFGGWGVLSRIDDMEGVSVGAARPETGGGEGDS
jgi:hypothetical protein